MLGPGLPVGQEPHAQEAGSGTVADLVLLLPTCARCPLSHSFLEILPGDAGSSPLDLVRRRGPGRATAVNPQSSSASPGWGDTPGPGPGAPLTTCSSPSRWLASLGVGVGRKAWA